MYKKEISKEEINQLPMAKFSGQIHLITNHKDSVWATKALSQFPVVGFDTETRPAFKKGQKYKVSLLQLSTQDNAYIFRLNQETFNSELKNFLSSSDVIKAGVAVRDDLKGLREWKEFQPGQFVEIGDLGRQLGIKQLGLRSLAAMILSVRISKKFKLTNWAQENLNEDQLNYAATDAWIGLCLYNEMSKLLPSK